MNFYALGLSTIQTERKTIFFMPSVGSNDFLRFSGQLEFTKMFEMLRLMSPPVGFGTKCPSKLAYKVRCFCQSFISHVETWQISFFQRLIRMNMPIDDKRQVHFTTTLFALIRESLEIKMRTGFICFHRLHDRTHPSNFFFCLAAEEMDEADNELRDVLCKVWPNHAKKQIRLHDGTSKTLLDLVVPPKHGKLDRIKNYRSRWLMISFLNNLSVNKSIRIARNAWSSKVNRRKDLRNVSLRW